MSEDSVHFSDDEIEGLTEIFNIGMGRAADSLSQLVGNEVLLKVPTIVVSPRQEAVAHLAGQVGQRICAVKQRYHGSFDTEAILMFPEENSLELVRSIVGSHVPLELVGDMEQEAMAEVGNILLNAATGSVGTLLKSTLTGSLPVVETGSSEEILGVGNRPGDVMVILMHISFRIVRLDIKGHVAYVLDLPSVKAFKESLARFMNPTKG